jgi:GTP-binding protein Era
MSNSPHRSGYVALIGRPNVGKSTLLNTLLGQKLSIVSARPQTTRNRVLGIWNDESTQIIFLDTPGLHEPHTLLNRKMVDAAIGTLRDVDLAVWLLDAKKEVDPSRAGQVIDLLRSAEVPVLLAPNKIDTLDKSDLLPLIAAWTSGPRGGGDSPPDFEAIIPISALKGIGTDRLLDEVRGRLPKGPAFFPKDQLTDRTERFVVSEIVREKLFHYLDRELPYSVAVEIEDFEDDTAGGGMVRIIGRIWVERGGQKAIVIGKGGSMIKRVGTAARLDVERLLGCKVFLRLTVGVKDSWTTHRRHVDDLGKFSEGKS